MTDRYTLQTVDAVGGTFAVGDWAGAGEPVLCIHGISSTHRLWSWTAAHAPDHHLVAPDLRGRGGSVDVGGPYGLGVHADDMVRVLDALGIERVTVAGMSLGGFIAVVLAARAPDRVSALLLVDGGLPMRLPLPDLQRDQLPAVFASRMERTRTPWASADEYIEFFLSTMGPLLDADDPMLRDYLRYDLRGDAPSFGVKLDPDALLGDSDDVFFGPIVSQSLDALAVPARLLRAEWSIGAGTPAAYDEAVVEEWRSRLPAFDAVFVPGTDHASLPMTDAGGAAAAIADELRRLRATVA